MSAFRINLLAPGITAEPKIVKPADVTEELRQLGLEWKTADTFHGKQVVVVIEPCEPDAEERIAHLERKLADIHGIAEGCATRDGDDDFGDVFWHPKLGWRVRDDRGHTRPAYVAETESLTQAERDALKARGEEADRG